MTKGFFYLWFIIIISFIPSCKDDDNPTNSDKPIRTVRYFAFITPATNGAVSKTFTYTNENGGSSQSGANNSDGTFSKTIQFKSGTFVELKASGSTSQELSIGGRVIIYVDGNNIAESNASSRKYSNSVSVSAVIP